MKTMTIITGLLSFIMFLSSQLLAGDFSLDDLEPAGQIKKDNVQVQLYNHKNSTIKAFKVKTHVRASLDSVLNLIMDSQSCIEWVHDCKDAKLIERLSFKEQYHYQICDIPFPFKDRDFIFHSIMEQDPKTKTISISITSSPDFCHKNQSELCIKINRSKLVRVKQSIGIYKLEPDEQGTTITWIQHTDPAGSLPSLLVNQFVQDVPYWTMIKLAKKVQQDKYKQAKLIYNNQGIAIAFDNNQKNRGSPIKELAFYPSF